MGFFAVVAAQAAASPPGPARPGQREAQAAQPAAPVSIAALAAEGQTANDLTVHEWGTFLGMSGSDGTALDGMYHEEHALPSFVHTRSRDQLRLPWAFLKGETPVIYFYTERPMQVRIGVGFPQGIWTQWYPQAALVRPSLVQQAKVPDRLQGGRICWFAELIPASEVAVERASKRPAAQAGARPELPPTPSDALWNHARQVDAAFVKTVDDTQGQPRAEYERFLFYRGLGQARLPLRSNARHGGTLSLDREPALGGGVRHVFVLRVENGRGVYQYHPALRPGEELTGVIPVLDKSLPLPDFTKTVAAAVAARLTESGLYPKEAQAMVNTWSKSYFQTEGIRVLFVLPQSWTDTFIPITIEPRPRQVVRVMVGRLELLSRNRERLAETAINELAGPDPIKRQQAFEFLLAQGRYVEPIVRRILKTTQDDGVRTVCRRLLLTEFVTDLRAALRQPADGKPLDTDPLELRAHLARLLREIGLDAEARTEGAAVWRTLRSRATSPGQPQPEDPAALELQAAALEAVGVDQRAAEVYARRVEHQVKSLKPGPADPYAIVAIRDWWVGRAYARCLIRSGKAAPTIAALEEKLIRSSLPVSCSAPDPTTRVLLALLLDAQGKSGLADEHWIILVPPSLALRGSAP
jgi:hypothetical protein